MKENETTLERPNQPVLLIAKDLTGIPYPMDLLPRKRPYAIFAILQKAGIPRTETNPGFIDMSDPQAVAQKIAHETRQITDAGNIANFSSGGIVLPTKDEVKSLASPLFRQPTPGEEQRVRIFNQLLAKVNTWERQKRKGEKTPIHTTYEQAPNGRVTRNKLRVTEHLIFALKITLKTMYEGELVNAPTKPLADLAKKEGSDENIVQKEITERRLKLQDTPQPVQSEQSEEEYPQSQLIRQEATKPLSEEEQKKEEEAKFAAWVKAIMGEAESLLRKYDQPNKEAGKYISKLMEMPL